MEEVENAVLHTQSYGKGLADLGNIYLVFYQSYMPGFERCANFRTSHLCSDIWTRSLMWTLIVKAPAAGATPLM